MRGLGLIDGAVGIAIAVSLPHLSAVTGCGLVAAGAVFVLVRLDEERRRRAPWDDPTREHGLVHALAALARLYAEMLLRAAAFALVGCGPFVLVALVLVGYDRC